MKTYKVEIDDYGTSCWYFSDKLHREDGPACEFADGTKYWYLNGERHREDGPAIEFANGTKFWYIDNKKLSEKEFNDRSSCAGKMVMVDGKKYKLVEV